MPKVAIIGAGQVGSTTAMRIAEAKLADVVLVDIVKGLAQGKALDMMQAAPIVGHNCNITGSDDFSAIKGSNIVVVTAGLPRMPGMSREDLLEKNTGIMKSVAENIKKYSPEAVVIVITNPLDVMTYLCIKLTGFSQERVIGMGGVLDSSRLSSFIAQELECSVKDVKAIVLGSHGDSMIPLAEHTTVKGKPITDFVDSETLNKLVERTKNAGAEVVKHLKTGSAFYAPSASVYKMVKCMLEDDEEILPCSVLLKGEYGLNDVCIGVPVKLCSKGVKEIIELELSDSDKKKLEESAAKIKEKINIATKSL